MLLVRTDRIELSTSVWKTVILPLNYTRKFYCYSGSGGTRTLSPRFKRPVPYQLSHEPSDFVFFNAIHWVAFEYKIAYLFDC